MDDLFAHEQNILDEALLYSQQTDDEKYAELAKEYGRLLRHLRRSTKVSDRTATSLNESKHELLDKVHYDALTGIYNRRFLDDDMSRIVKSVARSGGMLSVMMLDIDFFKRYNDTYGHSAGDSCLKIVAKATEDCLSRPDDYVARYGGEEFAIILVNTDETGARFVAGKILESIVACNIEHENNDAAPCVTVSIGVTTGKVEKHHTGSDYLKQADRALYQSKQSGRNRYTYIDFWEA